MKEKRWTRYVAWFIFAVALIVVYKTIDSFGIIFTWFGGLIRLLMPFGLGILLAYMLYFPCRKIEKLYGKINLKFFQKRKRKFSVVTVYVILILAVVILLNVIFPMLYESIIELADSLPNYYNKAVEFLSNQPKDSIITKIHAVDYIKKLEDVDYVAFVTGLFDFDNIGKYIKGITSVAGVIFDIFITIIVSIYILFERNDIKSFLKNLFKATCSELGYNKISRYYGKTNNIFYNYITAQILDAIVVGVITSIAMLIMNVKYAVLLGFIIGLFNIIPYFGAIFGVGIAILITIFTGGIGKALWLALVIIILQQIDANIINPKILGDSLQLSRILIIFAVTFFGAYFGVLGMFLGVPIIALIKVFVFDFIDEKNKEKELVQLEKSKS
ncbi:MAG: AI-2E family transporter [Clostridia bacterium]|nr:AI-2E family transporter [Clostridia bacterium]